MLQTRKEIHDFFNSTNKGEEKSKLTSVQNLNSPEILKNKRTSLRKKNLEAQNNPFNFDKTSGWKNNLGKSQCLENIQEQQDTEPETNRIDRLKQIEDHTQSSKKRNIWKKKKLPGQSGGGENTGNKIFKQAGLTKNDRKQSKGKTGSDILTTMKRGSTHHFHNLSRRPIQKEESLNQSSPVSNLTDPTNQNRNKLGSISSQVFDSPPNTNTVNINKSNFQIQIKDLENDVRRHHHLNLSHSLSRPKSNENLSSPTYKKAMTHYSEKKITRSKSTTLYKMTKPEGQNFYKEKIKESLVKLNKIRKASQRFLSSPFKKIKHMIPEAEKTEKKDYFNKCPVCNKNIEFLYKVS